MSVLKKFDDALQTVFNAGADVCLKIQDIGDPIYGAGERGADLKIKGLVAVSVLPYGACKAAEFAAKKTGRQLDTSKLY